MDTVSRVQQLREEGNTGSEIAKVLLKEGFTIEEAFSAFYEEGYVVSILPFTSDISELHVSDDSMEAGLVTMLMASEPRTLPSVIWDKNS
jgi:hypothetical protein